MSHPRKGCLIFLSALVFLMASPVLWRNAVKLYYQRSIYQQPDVPGGQVAVVFGAAVYGNGRLSPVLRDRVDTAIALYKTGQVDHILVSGDNRNADYDEPGAMMAYAIDNGVDPIDITADRAGHRTYDTCYRAGHVFDVRNAVLVTQQFHLPRALLTCEGLGIEAVGAVADLRTYRGAGWYELRETAATVVALWDVVRREPPPLIELARNPARTTSSQIVDGN
ncbi:MAG: YdcF family protein [Anaerolineales bacterium]|uniref:SanA/YdcF family protein n=1 Tax=Promineifilum sp. TaxID=2664178 RepID=UPI001D50D16E|nr:YdcF family protein [Anaerolineales bacterium]MCB8936471.1 YdcF family protein [Promineifilum sp.]MCO5178602.1 YdcF family protein [Promineifilum sp.]